MTSFLFVGPEIQNFDRLWIVRHITTGPPVFAGNVDIVHDSVLEQVRDERSVSIRATPAGPMVWQIPVRVKFLFGQSVGVKHVHDIRSSLKRCAVGWKVAILFWNGRVGPLEEQEFDRVGLASQDGCHESGLSADWILHVNVNRLSRLFIDE